VAAPGYSFKNVHIKLTSILVSCHRFGLCINDYDQFFSGKNWTILTGLTMVFKMVQSARKRWERLNGNNRVADVIKGGKFKGGIAQINSNIGSAA
jgi:hypothetical protein